MGKVKYTEGKFNDTLEEVGQELDSSRNGMQHEVGQFLMFIRSLTGGSTPSEAAKSLLEHEEKWQQKTTPYG